MPLLPAARVQRTAGARHELRRRPRLPVPVLVLHDHQRAGTQVAAALAGRRRADRPRERRPGPAPLLHHRRQFRPQQGLGADPRPADPAARGRGAQDPASSSRSTRSATRSRTSSRSARAPACKRVFIGLENINPDNLIGAKKRQNKITEYRKMLLAWKQAGVITYAGYILGFPNDTPESILHDIEVIKSELPVDLLEFFFLTPLPGSEDHQKLHRAGRRDGPGPQQVRPQPRCTTAHPRMSQAEWERAYRLAWETLLHDRARRDDPAPRRRDGASARATRMLLITWFRGSHRASRACTRSRAASSGSSSAATAGRACRSSRSGGSIRAMRRDGRKARALGHPLRAARPDLSQDRARPRAAQLQ